jgi:hypothetical protein
VKSLSEASGNARYAKSGVIRSRDLNTRAGVDVQDAVVRITELDLRRAFRAMRGRDGRRRDARRNGRLRSTPAVLCRPLASPTPDDGSR